MVALPSPSRISCNDVVRVLSTAVVIHGLGCCCDGGGESVMVRQVSWSPSSRTRVMKKRAATGWYVLNSVSARIIASHSTSFPYIVSVHVGILSA